MDAIVPESYNPHLKRVLKCYQDAAIRSLSGPSGYTAAWNPAKLTSADHVELEKYRKAVTEALKQERTLVKCEYDSVYASPPFPVQSMPVFTPIDVAKGERSDTVLEGETIACFVVGGEKRLCLPQILNTVLRDFSLQQINSVCDELHIYCSRCSLEQLQSLKMGGILPFPAPSCGLITKTDAERLCNALLHRSPERTGEPPSPNSFKVYHECFGKCKGIFNPEMYTSPDSPCIECCDCHGLFSVMTFVGHSHKALENRTCHWGFDSANWRSYLLLSKDQECKDKLQSILERMKDRFNTSLKRKEGLSEEKEAKKTKYDEEIVSPSQEVGLSSSWADVRHPGHMSAFRPWSPNVLNLLKEGKGLPAPPALMRESGVRAALPSYLHTGPPILLNPERVVPHYQSSRYEPHFAPNVSLAPLAKKKEDEEGEEKLVKEEEKDGDLALSTTDTDDSAVSEPSTPTETGDRRVTTMETFESSLEREVEMMKKALDGEVTNKEKYLEEFEEIHKKMETDFSSALESKKRLQQELEFLRLSNKQKLRELSAAKKSLHKELQATQEELAKAWEMAKAREEELQQEISFLRQQQQENFDPSKVYK
ncbi:ski oncogene-like [Lingula anatina]|uniref:Ski oncogene-like n=1 Tax=Lingula anatina TaxID=7574 RepID=A0A1S3JGV9_LINAN|nr:ski oncogene-like [Lingula anatina]|eukprot:XP_013409134.1 ski oncogene-like [Lingula anatina]